MREIFVYQAQQLQSAIRLQKILLLLQVEVEHCRQQIGELYRIVCRYDYRCELFWYILYHCQRLGDQVIDCSVQGLCFRRCVTQVRQHIGSPYKVVTWREAYILQLYSPKSLHYELDIGLVEPDRTSNYCKRSYFIEV